MTSNWQTAAPNYYYNYSELFVRINIIGLALSSHSGQLTP